jgi:hypothetical protein
VKSRGEVRGMRRTAVLLASIAAVLVWAASALAGGRSEDAHHHVVICHRTGSESNPYVVINIPWTAWTEAHSPGASPAHPTLNGRDDIMLEDPASAPGAKDGFTADDCVTTTGTTGTTGTPPAGTTGSSSESSGGVSPGGTGGGTTGGVAGAQVGGTLPFTGIPVWVPLLAGLGLLSCGYTLLRWKGRTSA